MFVVTKIYSHDDECIAKKCNTETEAKKAVDEFLKSELADLDSYKPFIEKNENDVTITYIDGENDVFAKEYNIWIKVFEVTNI